MLPWAWREGGKCIFWYVPYGLLFRTRYLEVYLNLFFFFFLIPDRLCPLTHFSSSVGNSSSSYQLTGAHFARGPILSTSCEFSGPPTIENGTLDLAGSRVHSTTLLMFVKQKQLKEKWHEREEPCHTKLFKYIKKKNSVEISARRCQLLTKGHEEM